MTVHPLPFHIDSTMISCARSCLKKFDLEFVRGFRPEQVSIDLHAGGCFATALETTYKHIHENGGTLVDALVRGYAAFEIEWGDFEIPEYKRTAKTKERMWDAIEYYFAQFPPLTDHVQPYIGADGKPTFEYTFAIPLEPACEPRDFARLASDSRYPSGNDLFPLHPSGEPFLYSGRFDMLGTYSNIPCVKDDKTTGSSIGTAWADQWDLRSQFMGYVWACQQAGIPLNTVVVRGLAIQKTQFVHAEAVKTYSDALIARWHEQLRRDLWRIRRAYDEQYYDFNLADSCSSYGGCVFRGVCSSVTNEDGWLSHFRIKHWNPLEKNPIKETTDDAPLTNSEHRSEAGAIAVLRAAGE